MKTLVTGFIIGIFTCCMCSISVYASSSIEWFGTTDEVITIDQDDVVGAKIKDSKDTLRDGTELVAEGIGDADNNDKIYYKEVKDTKESWEKTAKFVKALVNYALAVVGLIALLYIAYHGFLTVTAAGNDDQTKKGWEGMKYGAIALSGIAIAWFLASLIFWLIQQTT